MASSLEGAVSILRFKKEKAAEIEKTTRGRRDLSVLKVEKRHCRFLALE